jgi:septum formation protein
MQRGNSVGTMLASTMSARTLVLASTSQHRRMLMQRLGTPFVAIDSGVDEAPFKTLGLAPPDLVVKLAEAKARAVREIHPQALIIGSDQCAELDGHVLGKPGSAAANVDQLERLAGRSHRLLTGLCLLDACSGNCQVHLDIHVLHMRPLTRAQIRSYVERDQPLDCAGGYRIEASGMALFERVEGRDTTAVIGLPMMQLVTFLLEMGFDPIV